MAGYARLANISDKAWLVIVAAFDGATLLRDEDGATQNVAVATFTENLLRPIIPLTPEQQLQLVSDLVHKDKNKRITKNRFRLLAEQYAQQNKDKEALAKALPHISEELLEEGFAEIETGN